MSRFGVRGVVDSIGGFVKGANVDTIALRNADEAANLTTILKGQGMNVNQYGNITVVNLQGLGAQARRNLDEIKAAFKAETLYDAGTVSSGGISWKKVLIVAGGVVVAIVLIDPKSGAAIGSRISDTATQFMAPFIPSILSVMVPSFLIVSSALVMFGVFQRM